MTTKTNNLKGEISAAEGTLFNWKITLNGDVTGCSDKPGMLRMVVWGKNVCLSVCDDGGWRDKETDRYREGLMGLCSVFDLSGSCSL